MSWLSKLRASLGFSRESLSRVEALAAERRPLDREFWDELEEILIAADFGVPTAAKILDGLRTVAKQELWRRSDEAIGRFKEDVQTFLTLPDPELHLRARPAIVLVVGVNGSGKTTTIGKLAHRLRSEGKRVMVVAGDTFRAAAADQLAIWADRSGSEFVRGREGSDPASVVYDGVSAAKARGVDVVFIDTAGRLQTKINLMEELKKIRRVIERANGAPPDETLLVIDGTTGQNALSQARLFDETTKLTGVIVTKLDSSAKGGVLVGIVDLLEVPIKFIGIGEGIDELRPFDPASFVRAIFESAA
ncbi:MAG: signal recognition particle-docking protein FtsY [Vulcanimicrobiaceae bacterium]